jgi:hypothetical protein
MQTCDLPGFEADTLVGVPETCEEEEGCEDGGCGFAGRVEPNAAGNCGGVLV